MEFLHHWLWEDIWVPVWPNWCAGIVASAVIWFWKGKQWFKRHEAHQKKIDDIHKHLLKGSRKDGK